MNDISTGLRNYLPEDIELISHASHMVFRSPSAKKVYRTDKTELITNSIRIQDAVRSHRISWCLGHKNKLAVVAPTTAEPIIVDSHLVSEYPLLSPINSISELNDEQANELGTTIAAWASTCRDCEHDIDTLRVDEYVMERLGFASLHQNSKVTSLSNDLKLVVNELSREFSFSALNTKFMGYVHGDMHHGNIVIDDEGRARIIDFDSFKFGTPLYDLGSLRYFESAHVEDQRVSERIIASFLEGYDRGRAVISEEQLIAGEAWKRISSLSRLIVLSDGGEESLAGIDSAFTNLRNLLKPVFKPGLRQ